jgi:hypothetical protein
MLLVCGVIGCGGPASGPPDAQSDGNVGDAGSDIVLEECGAETPSALVGCVERNRYAADLAAIAIERPAGSANWQAIQDLCAERLGALGYDVELQRYSSGTNVIGRWIGAELPAEQVVVAAHYDHIRGCEGANDNASGVAGLLETARVLALGTYARSITIACMDEEELELLGSRAFVREAMDRGESIRVSYVYDMIAFTNDEPNSQRLPDGFEVLFPREARELAEREYRADFFVILADEPAHEQAVRASAYADALGVRGGILELRGDLKNEPLLADLRRSDHASFWEADIPALVISDTGELRYDGYHCMGGPDSVSRLDDDFATRVIRATLGSLLETLELR